jgi:hypothetical protein
MTTVDLAIAEGCFEMRLRADVSASGSESKKKEEISDRYAEALTPCQGSSSTPELGRPTRDHLFMLLSVTLVRLDSAILELLTSDHPTLCQGTKKSFLNGRRRFVYL